MLKKQVKTPLINVKTSTLCLECDSHCCAAITLNHSNWKNTYNNRRKLARNLREFGFIKNPDGSYRCRHYHPENTPESCDTYHHRPQFCKDYLCEEALRFNEEALKVKSE